LLSGLPVPLPQGFPGDLASLLPGGPLQAPLVKAGPAPAPAPGAPVAPAANSALAPVLMPLSALP
jgi:hypothetical protein